MTCNAVENVTAGKLKVLFASSSDNAKTGYVEPEELAPMLKVPKTFPSSE